MKRSSNQGTRKVAKEENSYLSLARATKFVDFAPSTVGWHAVNIELTSSSEVSKLRAQLAIDGKIPSAYGVEPLSDVVTARVSEKGLETLAGSVHVHRFEFATPFKGQRSYPRTKREVSEKESRATKEPALGGKATLLGVIDTGCPFAHQLLRRAVPYPSTRVRSIWDQDEAPDFEDIAFTPSDFGYGGEVARETLDGSMQSALVGGQVDERWCYKMAGYRELCGRESHGAHILGGCLGYGIKQSSSEKSPLADADVVFVQLPRDRLQVPSRAALAHSVLDGVRWIIARAKPEETHIVINLSYGSTVGPHDGTSILEQGLDGLIKAFNGKQRGNKLEILVAAGNQSASRLAAPIEKLESQEAAELVWRVPPASEMPAFMEMWLPDELEDAEISIYEPGESEPRVTVTEGKHKYWPSESECVVAALSTRWSGRNARMILIRLAPTFTSDGTCGAAAGYWRVTVKTEHHIKKSARAYIAGATGTFGFASRGKQSSFVLPHLIDDDEASKQSLSGFACGQLVLVVGGYRLAVAGERIHVGGKWRKAIGGEKVTDKGCLSGPARDGLRKGPNYLALVQQSSSLPAIRGMGNASGVNFDMNGTSVAAAIASRNAILRTLPKP